MTIDGRRIADDTDAFAIAEIGCNHQGAGENPLVLLLSATGRLLSRPGGVLAGHADPAAGGPLVELL